MDQDHKLSKRQQNEVFQAITVAGLDPLEFCWKEVVGAVEVTPNSFVRADRVSQLHHNPTSFYFTIDTRKRDSYVVIYKPGGERPLERQETVSNWARVMDYVRRWLKVLKEEWVVPDLWTEVAGARQLASAAESATDAIFSELEQERIAVTLDKVRDYLLERHQTQHRYIEEGIAWLKSEMNRQGRKAWFFMLSGVLLGYTLTLMLPPDQVREMFGIASLGLSVILTGPLQLE